MLKQLVNSGGLLLALVLFVAINIIANNSIKSARLDLTDNDLYTLSEGSRNILGNLGEPITLRFYLSQKLVADLPGISNYTVRVRELLEEYRRISGDKIKLHIIDPEPFSEEEDEAVGYGLKGVPIDTSNTTFYFGLAATNSTDDQEIIPFFQNQREEFLEYDLTKIIYRLSNPTQNVVGLISTLPLEGAGMAAMFSNNAAQPWMMLEQMRELFEVRRIETDAESIPDEVKVLMIVHPTGLTDATLYAIDQYVLGGGRVIVFADPYSEVYEPPTDPQNPLSAMQAPRNSEFKKMLDAWGVEMLDKKVAGDIEIAKKVQARSGQRSVVINYPVWMDMKTDNFNADDIVTGKLGDITMATAGILRKKEGAEITFTPLLQTSAKAMQIDTAKIGMFADPQALVRNYKAGGVKLTLAARISGTIKTAFPDGKPKKEGGEENKDEVNGNKTEETTHLTESTEPVNLIVVADTDILDDQFWVRVQNFLGQRIAIPTAANNTFVTNALDSLSGSNDLISVRNRGSSSREFIRVEEIRSAAEKRFREKERELQARLKETESKLRELQNQRQDGKAAILSEQQQQEILNFRNEQVKIRKQLRNVQHELRKDIEGLESRLKFVNIGLMPILFGIGGLILGIYRIRRRRSMARG